MSLAGKPMKLPPVPRLRVHQPKTQPENPCLVIMSSVLACWASAGYNATGCLAIENQLRQCMDGPAPPRAPPNTVNYHLGRMKKDVTQQGKRGKKKN